MTKRHPGARRTTQESQSNADDAFVARVLEVNRWAQGNQQTLTVIAVVVGIAILGLLYWGNYRAGIRVQAAEQLEMIHQSIAINDTEGAKADLATYLERFDGTPFEGEARLILGELYLESGDPQQAMAVLAPLGTSPRRPIEFQGAALLGATYEQEGRWDDAAETYLSIANRSELDFQVRDALIAAARIRNAQGEAEAAIGLYERVLDVLDENSPDRGLYEMRIQEIRSVSNT